MAWGVGVLLLGVALAFLPAAASLSKLRLNGHVVADAAPAGAGEWNLADHLANEQARAGQQYPTTTPAKATKAAKAARSRHEHAYGASGWPGPVSLRAQDRVGFLRFRKVGSTLVDSYLHNVRNPAKVFVRHVVVGMA